MLLHLSNKSAVNRCGAEVAAESNASGGAEGSFYRKRSKRSVTRRAYKAQAKDDVERLMQWGEVALPLWPAHLLN